MFFTDVALYSQYVPLSFTTTLWPGQKPYFTRAGASI